MDKTSMKGMHKEIWKLEKWKYLIFLLYIQKSQYILR